MKLFFAFLLFLAVSTILAAFTFFLAHQDEGAGWGKSSPFECGFAPLCPSSHPFSLPFFTITILFLLFDIEILFISFHPMTSGLGVDKSWLTFFIMFVIFFTTLYEWWKGSLMWF